MTTSPTPPAGQILLLQHPGAGDPRGSADDLDGLERSALLARLEEANRALEHQRVTALLAAEVAGAFAVDSPPKQSLACCCGALVRHLDAALARVWTLEPCGTVLELQASAGIYDYIDGAFARMNLGEGKVGSIAAEGLPHLTNDLLNDPRIRDLDWVRREGLTAFAGYPLIFDGRVLGVLAIFARRPLANDTLASLASVAGSIALGVARSRAAQKASTLATVVQNSHDFIGVASLDKRTLFLNEAGQQLVGADSLDEARRGSVLDYFFAEDHAHLTRFMDQRLQEHDRGAVEVRMRHLKSGETIPVLLDVFTLGDADGQPFAFATVAHDLTNLKRDAAERERLIERLTETLRFDDVFAGVLGHDLRTPLAAMTVAAHAVLRRTNDAVIRRLMNGVLSSGKRMSRMIEQLLDFTRIRTGQGFPIEAAPADVAAVSRDIARELAPAHPGCIHLETLGDTTGTWDVDRLGQVLCNLLTNALQHGPAGAPVAVRLDGSDRAHVIIEIHNAGKIPDEIMPVLFEPFRGSLSKRDGSSGLGLGLYITEQIIRGHGGAICATSSEEEGTRFRIVLPRCPPPPARKPHEHAAPARDGARAPMVLVVEDDRDLREVLRLSFEDEGFRVLTAANGREALELLPARPHCVVLDIQMPVMSGAELYKLMREDPAYARTPIIITTADPSLAPSGALLIKKPVDLDYLIEAVRKASQSVS